MTTAEFELTEAQRMIHNLARQFCEREIMPYIRERDDDESFTIEIMRKMGEVGLLGGTIPSEYGGAGMDYVSYGLVCEELCRASPSIFTSADAHLALVASAIHRWGNEAQKRKYLPHLTRGEMIGAYALTEPNFGSDAARLETRAVRDGDYWVINGSKMWTTNGGIADIILVFAQTDKSKGHRGIGCFIVEKGTPGYAARTITTKLGMHGSNTTETSFQDVRVPADQVLAEVGQGFYIAMSALDEGRFVAAAGAVGIAQACLDACINYAKTRVQFNKPIGAHQLVQEMIADMVVDIEAARGLVRRAAYLRDKGERISREVSIAKYFATEAAVRIARNAIQLHGGYGYSSEYPVERYLRDAIAMCIYEGTSQVQKLIIARDALGISAFE